MARTPQDHSVGQSDSSGGHHETTMDATSGAKMTLPGNEFVTDATMLRDGQDLILRAPGGEEITVQNYFSADPAPVIVSEGGAALTPDLVDSFVTPIDGVQFAQKGSVDDESPVGVIKEASGEATITHSNGVIEKAAVGTPIYEGDIVETKGDGAVNITFVDDTTFAVSENARLAIDEYVFDPATQSGESNFSVLRGVFVFTSGLIGREDPDDVQIDTPVGSIGIRGTTIMGEINPQGESQITVVEGAIVVKNAEGEQTLSQQFETITLSGFDEPIENQGVLDASQIANDYNVVRTVSAPLFSTFDDMGQETEGEPADAPAESAPAEPDGDAAPVDKTEAPAPDETVIAGQASFEAGFDTSAGIETDIAFDATEPTEGSISDNIALPSTTPLPSTTATAPLPAPDPITNIPATTAGNNGGTGTTNPPPASNFDVDLNAVITGNVGGVFIPSIAANSGHGANVAALGDINHDGKDDYAFVNNQNANGHLFIDDRSGNNFNIDLGVAPYNLTDTRSLSLVGTGDFNGDGFGDIAIGAPQADINPQFNSGKVLIASGANPNATPIDIIGFTSGQFAGFSISDAGDFNGDGRNDLIIGAPESTGMGKTYMIFGTTASLIDVSSAFSGFVLTGGNGEEFGRDVAGIGDFNKDGYSDFVTTNPGLGTAKVYFGNNGGTQGSPLTITGITADPTDTGIPVASMGDLNGDGAADLAVVDKLNDTLHIFLGATSRTPGSTMDISTSNLKITANPGSELIGGGSAGDFNGDGRDDGVVAMRTGDMVDVIVFYGRPGVIGTFNPDGAPAQDVFHMTLDLSSPQFSLADPATTAINISVSTAGDLNGDGFDDLLIGAPDLFAGDGGLMIIYGRAEGAGVIMGNPIASADWQSLIGSAVNDTMTDATYANITFKSGNGDDTINLNSLTSREIDGGAGLDTLNLMSGTNISLRGLGENLSGIEKIALGSMNQQLTIGLDQIFHLLQESANGTLKFSTTQAGTGLTIHDNGDPVSGSASTALPGLGFINGGVVGSDNVWTFGGYTLLIDTTITTTVT